MYEFKLADLGEGMHEAEVVEWLIKVGETARLDQPIARVETDKAIVELPSPVAGRVREIRVESGQSAKVGEVLVIFDTASDGAGNGKTENPSAGERQQAEEGTRGQVELEGQPQGSPIQAAQHISSPGTTTATKARVLAAPAVRKLAFELGVDIERVKPSGASGRVSLDDVRAYSEGVINHARTMPPVGAQFIAPSPPAPTQDERQPLTGLRKRIAEHMERSWRTIPHATAFDEVDGSALVALRQGLKPVAEERGLRLTYMPILIKLLIPLLREFPIFNASLDEEKREIIYKRSYHIGVAAESPEGLLVPVLRDADKLTLLEVAAKLEKLIEGARTRTLSLPELSGSTFTLNNVGSFGGSTGTPIINHPEVAILAVGRLQDKVIVQNGAMVVRPIMPLTLSFDHRLIDGAMVGKFMTRFKALVENPQQLLLDMR